MYFFFKRKNADQSREIFDKLVEDFLDAISDEGFDTEKQEGQALAMLLKQTFLFLVDELELLSSNQFESLLQTEDPTSVDLKKFFLDYLENQSNTCKSEAILSKLYELNTVFYMLYECQRNEIDTNGFFLESQENKQNLKKHVEIMSKLKHEDLKELIKLNNEMIGNFNS